MTSEELDPDRFINPNKGPYGAKFENLTQFQAAMRDLERKNNDGAKNMDTDVPGPRAQILPTGKDTGVLNEAALNKLTREQLEEMFPMNEPDEK